MARFVDARTAATTEDGIAVSVHRIEKILTEMQAAAGERAAASERLQVDLVRAELAQATERLRAEIRAVNDRIVPVNADEISEKVLRHIEQAQPWAKNLFVPKLGLAAPGSQPFMAYSTCSATDCEAEDFVRICHELARSAQYHRKIWEWVFIMHHLRRLGVVAAGKKGLGFGVGTETMPSLFAKDGAHIVATDAPQEIGIKAGWGKTNEFASMLDDIRAPSIIDEDSFARLVSFAICDMNNIGDEFTDFDFCWSSCCLEHLGSLEAGMDFIVNSVEKTLKIGGVACHTTEFNLSSNEDTIRTGSTVIYRKQDIERLIENLRNRGHIVDDLKIAPDHHPLDFFVDVPPYVQSPHLKLSLLGFTSTSIGIIVTRGR